MDVLAQQLAAMDTKLNALKKRLDPEQEGSDVPELPEQEGSDVPELPEQVDGTTEIEDEAKEFAVAPAAISTPLETSGFEAIYMRFLNGVLVYRPEPENDAGRIEMPIRNLANPLEGTFDLSLCGDTGKYLSISTGYRKKVNPANVDKVEIWISPKFLIAKASATTARHYNFIARHWVDEAQVGIFWNWGGWEKLGWYDYLTSQNMEDLSKSSFYTHWEENSKSSCGQTRGKKAPCKRLHLYFN
jgi:hypothetical protein